jgi:hypothetical protein
MVQGFGSLKNFFNIDNLKKFILLLVTIVLLVIIEICLKFFDPSLLNCLLTKENALVNILLNLTNNE